MRFVEDMQILKQLELDEEVIQDFDSRSERLFTNPCVRGMFVDIIKLNLIGTESNTDASPPAGSVGSIMAKLGSIVAKL